MPTTYAYVIGSRGGPHKVGLSRSPTRRLSQLQVGSPVTLALKRSGPVSANDPEEVEAYAHWLLRESYLRGEWFKVTEEAAWVALVAAQEAVAHGKTAPIRIGGGGRPPLNPKDATVKTTLRLTQGVLDRIEALVGPNRTATFIRDAVEGELRRRDQNRGPGQANPGPRF